MANLRKKFSKIYDEYVDKIFRFIFLKVNSQEIAEDLCSEVFLRGWKAYNKSNNPEPNVQKIMNVQAFLYQIARNLVIDHYREKGRTQIISADYVQMSDPQPSLEEKAILKSDIDNIRLVLVSLKEEYQDVIIWHYLDGLTFSEIGQILDKSEGAVRVQTHRALKKLRKALNHEAENSV